MTFLTLFPKTHEPPANNCPVEALGSPSPLGTFHMFRLQTVVGKGQGADLGAVITLRTS